jgi:hypothetical protein
MLSAHTVQTGDYYVGLEMVGNLRLAALSAQTANYESPGSAGAFLFHGSPVVLIRR